MEITKNELAIIRLFIDNPGYLTSYDIALATGITRRQVRDMMAGIKRILKNEGYQLTSQSSKGYLLKTSRTKTREKLSKILLIHERPVLNTIPTLPVERRIYILKRLIEINDYIKIDDLADEILVSRSTISNDLKIIKKEHKKYRLSFVHKPNFGIMITGDEVQRRKPLCDEIFNNLQKTEMFSDFIQTLMYSENSIETRILDTITNHDIRMSDIALCDFMISLSVSINRIIRGLTIDHSPDIEKFQGRIEIKAAQEIAIMISQEYQITLSQAEINQIAIELICKRSTSGLTPENSPETLLIVDEILSAIYNKAFINIDNPKTRRTITLYVEGAINRLIYNEKIRNPLFDTLKTSCPLAYELALISSDIIENHYDMRMSMSELANFAIIFNTFIYKMDITKKKTLLVCSLGGGAAQLAQSKIHEKYEGQLSITKKTQFYQLRELDLNEFDLIISTIPIRQQLPFPCLNISPIITEDDFGTIDRYLESAFNKHSLETIFHPQLFEHVSKIKNKKALINKIYSLIRAQYPNVKESLITNLNSQDQISHVQFSNNVGLLRLNRAINSNNIVETIILDEPINWDKQKLQILIFTSINDSQNQIYNNIAISLGKIANDGSAIKDIITNPTYSNFISHLTT